MIEEDPDWTDNETMMILTLHNIAEAYKLLPTEVLARSTTFDLYVLDTHCKWLKYQESKSKSGSTVPDTPRLTQQQMLAMIQRVREKAKSNIKEQ